jgi:hypothetical protein
MDLFNDKAKMLNQRSLTDALMAHGYDKKKFLNWVDKYSKFLESKKQKIHEILDDWEEPEVQLPTEDASAASDDTAATTSTTTATTDDDSFESLLDGTEGEETDTDLFGNTASKAGQAAKVSAADALNRIKGFDFTI